MSSNSGSMDMYVPYGTGGWRHADDERYKTSPGTSWSSAGTTKEDRCVQAFKWEDSLAPSWTDRTADVSTMSYEHEELFNSCVNNSKQSLLAYDVLNNDIKNGFSTDDWLLCQTTNLPMDSMYDLSETARSALLEVEWMANLPKQETREQTPSQHGSHYESMGGSYDIQQPYKLENPFQTQFIYEDTADLSSNVFLTANNFGGDSVPWFQHVNEYQPAQYQTAPYQSEPYQTASYHTTPFQITPHQTVPCQTTSYQTAQYQDAPYQTTSYQPASYQTTSYPTAPDLKTNTFHQRQSLYPATTESYPLFLPTFKNEPDVEENSTFPFVAGNELWNDSEYYPMRHNPSHQAPLHHGYQPVYDPVFEAAHPMYDPTTEGEWEQVPKDAEFRDTPSVYDSSEVTKACGRTSSGRDKSKDDLLLQYKAAGMTYKNIREIGGFEEAESTLRGRYRTLTKPKEARVRKPEWTEADVAMLKQTVARFVTSSTRKHLSHSHGSKAQPQALNKVPWNKVAESMARRGCYRYGNATVKKKYWEVMGLAE